MKLAANIGLLLLAGLCGFAHATGPRVKWTYEAKSNLYGPPVVAEMHPAPGLETVICDAEVRQMICVDARGKELWRYDGGFKKRLVSVPALSAPGPDGVRLLLIGNADGQWACVDAATGQEVWKKPLGEVEWGNGLWADLDGDGAQEAVAPTLAQGVIVLDRAGNERWRYQGAEGKTPPEIRGPMAAADVDRDGKIELFGAEKYGVFCLNADGTLRWETITWDDFECGVVAAYMRLGPRWRLFALSKDDTALWSFDAATGGSLSKQSLPGGSGIYNGSSIAVGDLHQSPHQEEAYAFIDSEITEIVAGDAAGNILALSGWNGPLWSARTNGPTHVTISLGDVDGDGWCDILAAGGDHRLYCYDNAGRLQWDYATDLRLVYPPTISDVDEDGYTDILLCGSDSKLRCLTLDGYYDPGTMVWPMRGGNPALTNAMIPRFYQEIPFRKYVTETIEWLPNGGFEQGKVAEGLAVPGKESEVYQRNIALPKGWSVEGTAPVSGQIRSVPVYGWRLDTQVKKEGGYSLRTDGAMVIVSDPIPVPKSISLAQSSNYMKAVMFSTGPGGAQGEVRLIGNGAIRAAGLNPAGAEGEWQRWESSSFRAEGVDCIQFVLYPGDGEGWIDGVSLTGEIRRPAELRVLANQVGYDAGAPKHFVVQGNIANEPGTFVVKRGNEIVLEGVLQSAGRIQGAYGQDWGYHYWTGDFTAMGEPGEYVIEVRVGDAIARSFPFRVGENVLWDETAVPAYKFFYCQRCGMAIPGIHGACHLDDARGADGKQYELWGGWHDAGDYNTYDNAPYVHGLSRAYQRAKPVFDAIDQDGNGRADFLDEILWGAEHTRRMIAPDGSAFGTITSGYGFFAAPELETDNQPGTGDERPITGNVTGNDPSQDQASMAKMALWAADKPAWTEPAARSLQWALDRGIRGPEQFGTAVDLFEATKGPKWAALAKELFPAIQANAMLVESVRNYDRLFNEDHHEALRSALTAKADELVSLANNPFGVLTFGTKEQPNFFKTPADHAGWHVGTTMYLFEAAELVALAYQYQPDPRYLAFVYDQFNWTLGMNPFNLSMMEGCGDAFLPTYHNRHTFGGVKRGAIPGGIANGVTWRAVGDDRPFVDLTGNDIPAYEPNEFWLPHNTNYLNALTALREARK